MAPHPTKQWDITDLIAVYRTVDNILLRVKLDPWEKFGAIRGCENNVSGFAASKKFQGVLVFDGRKLGELLMRKRALCQLRARA